MSESCLSQKMSLCRCIETLNDDGCFKVIRLLQHSRKYKDLNQFLIRIAMATTNKMNVESLQHITNEIKQISCNTEYIQVQGPVDNNNDKSKNSDHENTTNIFPLFRLPVDIIKNTSLFLNEKDIFKFEKCCRLFYQMINNVSYLKQTKNFKMFTINNKRWDQIVESKYCFCKYSQTNAINVSMFASDSYNVTKKFINTTQLHAMGTSTKY